MPSKLENKAPSFHMYAGDFLSDMNVKLMSMRQRGIYLTLLLHEWIEGSLPTEIKHLKVLCDNCEGFESDWEDIKHCFYQEENRLYNPRLEKERKRMVEYREKKSQNGKKGARVRWQSHSRAIAEPSNKEIEVEVEVENNKTTLTKALNKEFLNEFWSLYPRKDNKKRANDKYVQLRKSNHSKEKIIEGLKSYIKQWKKANTEPEFIPMASTWLHQERFDDELISNSKIVEKLETKKTYEYMCKECGSEKKTDKKLDTSSMICECGDGMYESKNVVLHEIAVEKAKKSKPVISKKLTDKQEFEKSFNSLINKIGVR